MPFESGPGHDVYGRIPYGARRIHAPHGRQAIVCPLGDEILKQFSEYQDLNLMLEVRHCFYIDLTD
jgi:hypothetical protein